MKRAIAAIRAAIDARDVLAACGLALLWYGGEHLYPGSGYAAAGALLVAVATMVR